MQREDNFDFDIMVDKIKRGENFSWSRFGDGEWSAILQNRKEGAFNCDGHHFFPDLGQSLKNILEYKPRYYIGLQNMAKEQNKDSEEFKRLYEKNKWSDNEILHRANIRGWMQQFFDILKIAAKVNNRKVILIGNSSLRSMNKFHVAKFIEIPLIDCWLEYNDIRRQVAKAIDGEKNPIVLYCASMMSKVLIDNMDQYYSDNITQIDCGSSFDPYVGRQTRTYHKTLKMAE